MPCIPALDTRYLILRRQMGSCTYLGEGCVQVQLGTNLGSCQLTQESSPSPLFAAFSSACSSFGFLHFPCSGPLTTCETHLPHQFSLPEVTWWLSVTYFSSRKSSDWQPFPTSTFLQLASFEEKTVWFSTLGLQPPPSTRTTLGNQ